MLSATGCSFLHAAVMSLGGLLAAGCFLFQPAAIDSVDRAREATIFIVATGAIAQPDGSVASRWTGSGFFVSPEGLAVTNNHVVAGAAYLEALVAGEENPRSAHVVARAECADLAVIQVEGSRLPYFELDPAAPRVGLPVYAAGYPLSDPEFTLTAGIISKEKTKGGSAWTSVEGALEHDARIRSGNSGGPLIDGQARVVGVNFAGNEQTDQNFAVSAHAAAPLIERMLRGEDIDSVGLNGRAMVLNEQTSGIFVRSVVTGSPADELGLRAGDFVLSVENIPVGRTGTMTEMCEILHSRSADSQLAFEALRPSTSQLLRGNLNGDAPLRVTERVAADRLTPQQPASGRQGADGVLPAGMEWVTDRTGSLRVQVPTAWRHRITSPISSADGSGSVAAVLASPAPIEVGRDNWDDPAVAYLAFPASLATHSQVVDQMVASLRPHCARVSGSKRVRVTTGEASVLALEQCGHRGSAIVATAIPQPARGQIVGFVCHAVSKRDLENCRDMVTTLD